MFYGIDIGATKIELAVFDQDFNQLWTKRINTPQESYQDFLMAVVNLVKEADTRFSALNLIGIGIPGTYVEKDKTVYTTNIEVVKNKPFIRDLERGVNRSVYVNNDANCFALSEAYNENFLNHTNVLGLILGTGLGGGLIINHQIISGANGCSGEIGHMRLSVDGLQILGTDIPLVPCGCGLTGCCERYLSGTGFEWLYQHFYQRNLTARTIIEYYYLGYQSARQHVDRYLELLASYIGNLMVIIDPELIVIGGGLSNFDLIYKELPKRLPKYMLHNMHVPKIEKAKYGDAGGARGAALLCLLQQNKS